MKKFLTIFLTVMLFSTVFSATAETTEFVISNALKRMAAQLPEFEDPLLLRTKTVDNEIHVRVKGSPDAVYANWLGYQEEPEEVDLVNGVGVVDIEGHKYQLGATWNNKVYRDYYAYNGESDEWVPVKYMGAVKVGDTDMKLVSKSLSDVAYDENWVWVDNYLGGQSEPENNHIVNETTKENKNILAAGVPQGTMYVTQKAWSEVDVDGGVVYYVDGLYDASGYLVAYNSTAKNAQGQVVGTTTGWHYMVPSYVVKLDSIPLNVNGKVDKSALPDVDVDSLSVGYVAPRSEIEEVIVDAFEKVFNREHIGVYDDFVGLGGNSLSAIKLLSYLDGFNISAGDVLSLRTPSAIASSVSNVAFDLNLYSLDGGCGRCLFNPIIDEYS